MATVETQQVYMSYDLRSAN